MIVGQLNYNETDGLKYIQVHLEILGIRRLAEWDVLMFFYRHGASLVNPEQISRMLGYSGITVRAALDSLTSTGLLQRSRSRNGVRFFRLNTDHPEDLRCSLDAITNLAADRTARLLLIRCLRQSGAGRKHHTGDGLHLT
jgi:DNA-binding MarR family transcriptional regulator